MRGQPVSAQTKRCTLHQIGLHGCLPRRKTLLKMMHKKARKQFAEYKQTKDMDYWNYVLWSDETKINLFGSESHVNRKLNGRKKCGRKRCTTNRENRSLMRIVKQN